MGEKHHGLGRWLYSSWLAVATRRFACLSRYAGPRAGLRPAAASGSCWSWARYLPAVSGLIRNASGQSLVTVWFGAQGLTAVAGF